MSLTLAFPYFFRPSELSGATQGAPLVEQAHYDQIIGHLLLQSLMNRAKLFRNCVCRVHPGLPFYGLARLQEACGVPLPEAVQLERCEAVAEAALPGYKHLLALAADGKVFHTDDTRVVILACVREDKMLGEGEKRRATLTSGMVIKSSSWTIAL